MTALVLAAEAATALKADDANDGDGVVAVIGCAYLVAGGRLIINSIVYLLSTLYFHLYIHSASPWCELFQRPEIESS